MAVERVERLEPGMVLLADRGFCGYPLWDKAQATGADLLWRARTNTTPRHVETLDYGTWIGYHPDKVGVDRSLRRASRALVGRTRDLLVRRPGTNARAG